MDLSLNPTDILKFFSDRKRRDKEQIATWLELTAADARALAALWAQNRDLGVKAMSDRVLSPREAIELDTKLYETSNIATFTRLEDSLRSFSSVIDGRIDSEVQEQFVAKTADVIIRRNQVRLLYERLFGPHRQIIFLDSTSREDQFDQLDDAIELLTREAAALEVLARNFRASR